MRSTSRRGHWRVLLAVSLVLMLAVVVAACGDDDDDGGGGGGGGGGSKSMTLIAGVKGDEFYITMNCGAQAEAKKLGVSLNFQGPDKFAPDQQIPIVNAVGQAMRRRFGTPPR